MGGCPLKVHQEECAIEGKHYVPFALIERETLNHNMRRFRFGFQPDRILGVPLGKHITLQYKDDKGKSTVRKYTPVSSLSTHGYVDLIIKIYNKTEKYPEGGIMTQHLDSLKIGDAILMKGPFGDFEYLGKGQLSISTDIWKKSKIGLIAGGSGIAPLLQILRVIRDNKDDHTEIWLIFSNSTEDDMFLQEELESYLAEQPDKFHLHCTISRPSVGWITNEQQGTGHVNKKMIEQYMPPPGEDTMILCSGPPPFLFITCTPTLELLGYNSTQYHMF